MTRTTITILCSEGERAEITRRRDIRGFRSDNEYVKHLLRLGALVEAAMAGQRLNPDNFAAAFYTIASKTLEIGAESILAAETAQELREWNKLELEVAPLIVGKMSKPASQ